MAKKTEIGHGISAGSHRHFFWSWNIIVATGFASSLAPLEIAFGRWLVAACILLPLAWKRLAAGRKLLLKHAPLVVGLAVTGIVLDNTLIYFAGHTASAVNIGMLDMTGPIFLVLLSRIFLKTEISRRQFAGLIVAVIGVVVIILDGDFTRLSRVKLVSGDFFVLANTFGFAVYSLLQSRRPPEIDQSAMLGATVIVALPILAAGMLFPFPPHGLRAFAEKTSPSLFISAFSIPSFPIFLGTPRSTKSATSKPASFIICCRCSARLKRISY